MALLDPLTRELEFLALSNIVHQEYHERETSISSGLQLRGCCCQLNILRVLIAVLSVTATTLIAFNFNLAAGNQSNRQTNVPIDAVQILQKCYALNTPADPPNNFSSRSQTRRPAGNSLGDLLLDKGLIKTFGNIEEVVLKSYNNLRVIEVHGAWVMPGIIDVHSHIDVNDFNSDNDLILPWPRSLDGLNTHDASYRLVLSGGVTTVNVLAGSGDAIGGQAFTIKLRPTVKRSSSFMVLEPPHGLNGSQVNTSLPPRRRQMNTRMDTQWALREGDWDDLGTLPEDLSGKLSLMCCTAQSRFTTIAIRLSTSTTWSDVSTQVAALRNIFIGRGVEDELANRVTKVLQGDLVLAVRVHSADITANIAQAQERRRKQTRDEDSAHSSLKVPFGLQLTWTATDPEKHYFPSGCTWRNCWPWS
ncbi:hypothetical protein CPB83DRAFT_834241 [Crepidotus variabilis]|uniref:Amidohydrolase-related domain-containing protein n=1 Tax=Crepidotus variabilis TaxID=179855 RepID=A0A9P6EK55_9AGAR|nr:hypothetical protein CPB83DRAFT_834241 [Crepidotus variabilis]